MLSNWMLPDVPRHRVGDYSTLPVARGGIGINAIPSGSILYASSANTLAAGPALPNGITATTQASMTGGTSVATCGYADVSQAGRMALGL